MKNKNKFFPLIFLILGIILILITALVSLKGHIKQSNKEVNTKNIGLKEKAVKNEKEGEFFKKPEKLPAETLVKIYKEKRMIELYGDNELIGRFKIALGRAPKGKKQREGDNKTPEGNYYICYINSETKYRCFLGISYPNFEDAKLALDEGVIDKNTFQKIEKAIKHREQPPWNTPLGGAVGIHGGGTGNDWTYGCIAVSDENIDILKSYLVIKTPVEIYE